LIPHHPHILRVSRLGWIDVIRHLCFAAHKRQSKNKTEVEKGFHARSMNAKRAMASGKNERLGQDCSKFNPSLAPQTLAKHNHD
jgi:ribosomal protein L15E